jgi:HEAT repeat protein
MMQRSSTVTGVLLVLAIAGCGQNGPTLAGGKPVSFWVEALRDPDANIRTKAVNKLGNVGDADPQAFAAILSALHDEAPGVRKAALRALPKFGKRAGEATALVEEMAARDADSEVAADAAKLLESLREGRSGK